MMNHLKDYQASRCHIYHLLTYADEFAIGYFKKQDFITDIALPTVKYKGFIKVLTVIDGIYSTYAAYRNMREPRLWDASSILSE